MRNSQKVMQAMKQMLEENQAKPTQMCVVADFHTKEQIEKNLPENSKVILIPGDSPIGKKDFKVGS